jgi:hypothetical protein
MFPILPFQFLAHVDRVVWVDPAHLIYYREPRGEHIKHLSDGIQRENR